MRSLTRNFQTGIKTLKIANCELIRFKPELFAEHFYFELLQMIYFSRIKSKQKIELVEV